MVEFVSLARGNVDDVDPRRDLAPILPLKAASDLCWINDRRRRDGLECPHKADRPAEAGGAMAADPTETTMIATVQEWFILRELHTRARQTHGVAA